MMTVTCDKAQPLSIGKLPGRKQWALYTPGNGDLTVLAWFAGEEEAKEAARIIKAIANATSLDSRCWFPRVQRSTEDD